MLYFYISLLCSIYINVKLKARFSISYNFEVTKICDPLFRCNTSIFVFPSDKKNKILIISSIGIHLILPYRLNIETSISNSHQCKVPQYKPDMRACPHGREGRCGQGCFLREPRAPIRQIAHDIKIVLGDFNAKIGQEGIFGPTVGQFSLHSRTSPNGVRPIDFVAVQNMLVCSTRFQHLDIHEAS